MKVHIPVSPKSIPRSSLILQPRNTIYDEIEEMAGKLVGDSFLPLEFSTREEANRFRSGLGGREILEVHQRKNMVYVRVKMGSK